MATIANDTPPAPACFSPQIMPGSLPIGFHPSSP
jgi:hypothetical protein